MVIFDSSLGVLHSLPLQTSKPRIGGIAFCKEGDRGYGYNRTRMHMQIFFLLVSIVLLYRGLGKGNV